MASRQIGMERAPTRRYSSRTPEGLAAGSTGFSTNARTMASSTMPRSETISIAFGRWGCQVGRAFALGRVAVVLLVVLRETTADMGTSIKVTGCGRQV